MLLIVIVFSSVALGDGEIPGGGKTCPPPTTVCRDDVDDSDTIKRFFSELLDLIF